MSQNKEVSRPRANECADSASSRSDQLAQSYLVRDQNWAQLDPSMFSGLLNLKTLQPMKMKVKTQSQKRLFLLVLLSKNEKW